MKNTIFFALLIFLAINFSTYGAAYAPPAPNVQNQAVSGVGQFSLPFAAKETQTVSVGPVTTTTSVEYTLANISGGPGYMSHFWYTDNADSYYSTVNFYVDGETTPSVSFELAGLGGGHNSNTARTWTAHTSVETNAGTRHAYTLSYPVPYHTSLKVTIIPYVGTTAYARVEYQNGVYLPWKLWSTASSFDSPTSYTATQWQNGSLVFLNLGSGYSGYIVYLGIWATGTSDYTYMENAPVAYLDGAAVCGSPPCSSPLPQFNNSGFEDFYESSYYFAAYPTSTPWASIAQKGGGGTNTVMVMKDMLATMGGIKFNNGVLFRLELPYPKTLGITDTSATLSYVCLYYLPN